MRLTNLVLQEVISVLHPTADAVQIKPEQNWIGNLSITLLKILFNYENSSYSHYKKSKEEHQAEVLEVLQNMVKETRKEEAFW